MKKRKQIKVDNNLKGSSDQRVCSTDQIQSTRKSDTTPWVQFQSKPLDHTSYSYNVGREETDTDIYEYEMHPSELSTNQ